MVAVGRLPWRLWVVVVLALVAVLWIVAGGGVQPPTRGGVTPATAFAPVVVSLP